MDKDTKIIIFGILLTIIIFAAAVFLALKK
jgi:hypothetical protein